MLTSPSPFLLWIWDLRIENTIVNRLRPTMIIFRRLSEFVYTDPDVQAALRLLLSEKPQDVDPKPDSTEASMQEEGQGTTTCDLIHSSELISRSVELPTNASDHTHPPWIARPRTVDDLRDLADRLRLKAEGTRWAKERVILSEHGAEHRTEIAPRDRAIVEKARLMNDGCDLWMNRASFVLPDSLDLLTILADWFEVAADAIDIVMKAGMANEAPIIEVADLLPLIAEAQFGLRVAVHDVGPKADSDQFAAYLWVREICSKQRLFLSCYLRADEPLLFPDIDDLRSRILDAQRLVDERKVRASKQKRLFGKLDYLKKATSIDWPVVAKTVDELVGLGIPPSDRRIRDQVGPHISEVSKSDEWPRGFRLALREISKVQQAITTSVDPQDQADQSVEIESVSEWLEGRTVVLIGGDCRPERKKAIEQSFRLSELVWIETSPGMSVSRFEKSVARPDVVVVLLAIRWASHGHGDVQEDCDKYGKPLVRLPGGLGVNQIAEQIIRQCSERLALATSNFETT